MHSTWVSLIFHYGCVMKDLIILIFFKLMKLMLIVGNIKESQCSDMAQTVFSSMEILKVWF